MLELIIGQIPEAIFFSLFMIYAKGLKEKKILFTVLMVVEYLLLKYSFQYSWLFQIGYIVTTFLTLKILYKEKSQITDIFTFAIASIILIITSIPCVLIFKDNPILYSLVNRIIIFIFIFLFRNKLNKIQIIYKTIWNRNDKNKKKIKSTTFRSLNIVIFNLMFYFINLGMIYAIYYNSLMK